MQEKKSDADNKKIILFVLEIWREAVFKLTDCPRNVGDSATPSDKEDLISMVCPEKCYINFTPHSVQDIK